MGKHQTSEESKKEFIDIMGDKLGTLFHRLQNELVFAYAKWKQFKQLYKTQESVNQLNNLASEFFYYYEFILMESVVLSITRMNDPLAAASL